MVKNAISSSFSSAYHNLNSKQKEAVDTIYGSVLVLAGPGTGKTELLAVRVGNILQKGIDIKPYNILCLTFTDAGAYAMRNRLLKYIGPDAYAVSIHTYHSFCNQVIKENIESFGTYRNLQAVSDLEKVEIIRQIQDELPDDHILKRLKGNIYYDRTNLLSLFNLMKQENWRITDFEQAIEQQKALLLEDPSMYYKRKTKDKNKGDLKDKIFNKEVEKYEKTLDAARLIEKYNQLLKERERFDFQDMILWVLDQFYNNESLLAKYQEKYQFVLLDEYQDTNGSQNELVFKLTEFWKDPNLFAVGDDDQSIYRFQGANMGNITDFVDKFNPKIIVLEQNYRSDQKILNAASRLIGFNKDRIVNRDEALSKELIESRKPKGYKIPDPEINIYANRVQEEVGTIQRIKQLVSAGVQYKDIAVIYRNNADVNDIIKYLTKNKIPLNVRKKVNVLYIPEIKQLVNILNYILGEFKEPHSESRKLFEILHYPFFNLAPIDLAKISVYCSQYTDKKEDDRRWREVVLDKEILLAIGVSKPDDIAKVANLIESWIGHSVADTPQVLIEKIITDSHWLQDILLSDQRTYLLQAFNTFLNLVKDDSAKNQEFTINEFMENLAKMNDSGIELSLVQSIHHQEGINFVTAHSSKGLEFKHVFIIKALNKTWVLKNNNRGFKLPQALVPASAESDIEDDRRLFYVAMTRAEDGLYISYAHTDDKEKEAEAAVFLYESEIVIPEAIIPIPEEDLLQYMVEVMQHHDELQPIIDHQLVTEVLKTFKFSATALNKFLKCPLTFYFENILRVPMARTAAMGFGNAVHYALEQYFREVDNAIDAGILPPGEKLIFYFERGMNKFHSHFSPLEFQNLLTHGVNILNEYYEYYHGSWLLPREYKVEHLVDEINVDGIPIKGKLDKLIIYDDHIEVVDYKTGTYRSANLKPPLGLEDNGGDYWRQLAFYKLLIDNDSKNNYNFSSGTMDFLEKYNGNYKRCNVVVSELDIQMVKEQLIDCNTRLFQHDFSGCGEDNCKWCNFVSESRALTVPLAEGLEEDELI